jgi:hypothetical protein
MKPKRLVSVGAMEINETRTQSKTRKEAVREMLGQHLPDMATGTLISSVQTIVVGMRWTAWIVMFSWPLGIFQCKGVPGSLCVAQCNLNLPQNLRSIWNGFPCLKHLI